MRFGLGTTQFWYGGNREQHQVFHEAFHEHQINVIDTAEMYGDGRCEDEVGKIIRELGRDQIYVIDKILPKNVTEEQFIPSLKESLARLGTDCIDLYLLHWKSKADLRLLIRKMEEAKTLGYIREWGVSNFDVSDMEELLSIPGGENCFANQIFYNVFYRGVEFDLLPYLKKHGILPISYSTLERRDSRRRLAEIPEIRDILEKHDIPAEALLLSFATRNDDLLALFNTSSVSHLKENMKCLDFDILPYMDIIDRYFPAPDHKVPLEKR